MKDLTLIYSTICDCGNPISVHQLLDNQLPVLKEHSITCKCGIKIFTHIQAVKPVVKAA